MRQHPNGETRELRLRGATAQLRLRVDLPGRYRAGYVQTLRYPVALIGRDERADVSLSHPSVSSRHALVLVIGDRVFWTDLGSRTGVQVDGQTVRSGWLGPGTTLGIGPYTVGLASGFESEGDGDPDEDPLRSWAPGREPSQEVVLELLKLPNRHATWRSDRTLALVGRSAPCKLRLQDESVSRVHCGLLHTAEGLWVADLLGREGTFLNEERVRFARLGDGDVLRLGEIRVRLRYQPPARHHGRALPRPSWNGTGPSASPSPSGLLPAVVGRDKGGPGRRPDAATARTLASPSPSRPALPTVRPSATLASPPWPEQPASLPATVVDNELIIQLIDMMLGATSPERMDQVFGELIRIRQLLAGPRANGAEPAGLGQPARPAAAERRPILLPMARPPRPPAAPEPVDVGPQDEEGGEEVAPAPFALAPGLVAADDPLADQAHAQLCQRLAAMRTEREGRWQKFFTKIKGH
jgi:pSer/pThr/pTyr-binding forkhead associated (FHA) protein